MKNKASVIDASYVMSWLFPDENTETDKPERRLAPDLLPYEVTNALRSAVASKRISSELAAGLLKEFEEWNIEYCKVDYQQVLQSALTHKLSVYDASYLYLAQKLSCPLLTWDKKLKQLSN